MAPRGEQATALDTSPARSQGAAPGPLRHPRPRSVVAGSLRSRWSSEARQAGRGGSGRLAPALPPSHCGFTDAASRLVAMAEELRAPSRSISLSLPAPTGCFDCVVRSDGREQCFGRWAAPPLPHFSFSFHLLLLQLCPLDSCNSSWLLCTCVGENNWSAACLSFFLLLLALPLYESLFLQVCKLPGSRSSMVNHFRPMVWIVHFRPMVWIVSFVYVCLSVLIWLCLNL
jgi:hypothetical protein